MEVRLHHRVDEFREIAEPLYRRDPVVHTIELTLLRAGTFPEDSLLLTVWNDGAPVGAALQTPPYPLVCNAIPANAMDEVAADLAVWRPELMGVGGLRPRAVAFADAWHAITGRTGMTSSEERLYRLGTLRAPTAVRGAPRDATDDDRRLLVGWVERFVETASQVGDQFVLWDVDGTPVSMAMLRAPAANVSRIGPVFTPLTHRGRGYGSAVTAAAADLAHRSGTPNVVLFADLANPVSNAIYQRIGFEPVVDSLRIDFRTIG